MVAKRKIDRIAGLEAIALGGNASLQLPSTQYPAQLIRMRAKPPNVWMQVCTAPSQIGLLPPSGNRSFA
jgi:hypothetical protein